MEGQGSDPSVPLFKETCHNGAVCQWEGKADETIFYQVAGSGHGGDGFLYRLWRPRRGAAKPVCVPVFPWGERTPRPGVGIQRDERGAGGNALPPASGGDEEPVESSSAPYPEASGESEAPEETPGVEEDGWYHTKDEVGLYIHLYNRLPGNYVTKKEAQAQGWPGGNVERYTGEGTAIGGDRFGNREGLLPKAKGRSYTECDIDTVGTDSRGAKRIVFSNDGLVYYTGDHYNTFELLYGEP